MPRDSDQRSSARTGRTSASSTAKASKATGTGKASKTAAAAAKRAQQAPKRAKSAAQRAETSASSRKQAAAPLGGTRSGRLAGKATAGRTATKSGVTGRRRSRTRGAATLSTITVSPAVATGYAPEGPVARVIDALGNNVVADILGVARSQPSRWRSGQERLSPENRKRISDLDHVLDRLLLELHPEQVGLWLAGPNPHLGGARPIDVLQLRGAAAVLPAIDALAVGAFA